MRKNYDEIKGEREREIPANAANIKTISLCHAMLIMRCLYIVNDGSYFVEIDG